MSGDGGPCRASGDATVSEIRRNMEQRVLSIGQCALDQGRIRRVFGERLGLFVGAAATASEAESLLQCRAYALVFVNRVLDADGSSGVSLLRDLIMRSPSTPMMLVSDYEDAQQLAISAGAIRGFGKATLHNAETLERVRKSLRRAEAAPEIE